MIDLGIFRKALGINNRGEIVGVEGSDPAVPDPPDHAVIWRHRKRVRLDDLLDPAAGWKLQEAADINEVGQIVGVGTKAGRAHAFLLTPASAAAFAQRRVENRRIAALVKTLEPAVCLPAASRSARPLRQP